MESPNKDLVHQKRLQFIRTNETRLMFVCLCIYIYIYIYNELIEETARHRKLIFGMWECFVYGNANADFRRK